jgi:alkylhydroperoxidase family enzyme
MSRLKPLPPNEWPPEMKDALAALRPANPRNPPPPRDPSRPKGLNVLGMFAHHPALAAAYNTFNGYILYDSMISPRQRELLVLRVAHLRDAEYEWAQHAIMAGDAGISPEEVERIKAGPDADGWEPLDGALVSAADELVRDARIAEDTWTTLSAELDTQQLMDVVFTVGTYEVIAMAFRTFDVELDADLR